MRGIIFGSLSDNDTCCQSGDHREGEPQPVLNTQEIEDGETDFDAIAEEMNSIAPDVVKFQMEQEGMIEDDAIAASGAKGKNHMIVNWTQVQELRGQK